MRSRATSLFVFAFIAAAAIASLINATAHAFPPGQAGDTTADRVLGQPDFVHNSPNTIDPNSFASQGGLARIAVDRSVSPNRVYLVDTNNSRVIGFHSVSALVSGAPADLVVGQGDLFSGSCNNGGVSPKTLCTPRGAAVDSVGNLYVSDSGNNRILEYPNPFTAFNSTGQNGGFAASKVFGQGGSFFSSGCNGGGSVPTAKSLCNPQGITLDVSGNLYVADSSNNRVLEFNAALSGDATADRVFGQSGSFTADGCNNGGISANGLCAPSGVAVDGHGNLYVADSSNSRVLEYNTPLTTDVTADRVFGQSGSFLSGTCDGGGVSSATLCAPQGVGVDGSNNLYIADSSNHRTMEYNETANPPTNTTPNHVFGQANFTTNTCGNNPPSATTLCTPTDSQVDGSGELYVLDSNNNRALRYNTPLTSSSANIVLGQPDFAHNSANSVDKEAMSNPHGIAVDKSVSPNRLYVVDLSNNRVLGFASVSALVNGAPANLVIGQADFFAGGCNVGGLSASTMCTPSSVVVDGSGNLYVSDFSNNRVLEYNAPFAQLKSAGFVANKVFGQPNFTTNSCVAASVSSLCGPDGLAMDGANLFVADRNDNRVLEYNSALTNVSANHEFGQGSAGTDFTDTTCNAGGVTSTGLCHPFGVAVDVSHNVYIADHDNHRVLEYNETATPPTNFTANKVFGQAGSFNSNACNNGGVTANSLCNPHKVAVDASKNLYVTDNANNRLLMYKTPLTTDTTADMVFGQANNLTSSGCNLNGSRPSANTLCSPVGVAIDAGNNVYAGDFNNNRMLEYFNPLATPGAVSVPASLSFGNVAKGNTSVAKNVVATNTGSVPVNFTGVGITGTNAADFTLTSNGCLGYVLGGSSCTDALTFHPNAAVGTAESATLNLFDNASNTPQHVALAGTSANQTTINPTSLTFSVAHGTTSAAQNVTLTNNQSASITLSPAPSVGSPYTISATTCGATLVGFASCTISVKCTPPTVNSFPGTLTITDSPDSLSPHSVGLSCTGT